MSEVWQDRKFQMTKAQTEAMGRLRNVFQEIHSAVDPVLEKLRGTDCGLSSLVRGEVKRTKQSDSDTLFVKRRWAKNRDK